MLALRGIGRSLAVCVGLVGLGEGATYVMAQGPVATNSTTSTVLGYDSALVLDGATVIDVTDGRLLPTQTVVIVGNRIRALGPAGTVPVPAGARVVNARGKYLLPGFWDMHAHLKHPGAAGPWDSVSKFPQAFYTNFITHGVTGIRWLRQRFPYPHSTDSFRVWQREVAAGTRVGPRAAGLAVDLDFNGRDTLNGRQDTRERFLIATPEDARRILDSLKTAGVSLLKLHNSAITPELYFAIAREARRLGLRLIGHTPRSLTMVEIADSGQQSIEHANSLHPCWSAVAGEADSLIEPQCAPVALALVRRGTWLVPTLTVFARGYSRLDHAQQLVRVMRRQGFTRFLSGTDAGTTGWRRGVRPGPSVLEEMGLLVEAGLTPLEALQAATLHPAQFYDATDSLGTVASGKLADLVLLDADPLADIGNVKRTWAVVANGRYFERAALDALGIDDMPPRRPAGVKGE